MYKKSLSYQALAYVVSLFMILVLLVPGPTLARAAITDEAMGGDETSLVAEDEGQQPSSDDAADAQETSPAQEPADEGSPVAEDEATAEEEAATEKERELAAEQEPAAGENLAAEEEPAAEVELLAAQSDSGTSDDGGEKIKVTTIEEIQTILKGMSSGDTVKLVLSNDIIWNAEDFSECPFTVSAGTVYLNLNNHTLGVQATKAVADGCVIHIKMGAHLSISDGFRGTGTITGGWNSSAGGGIVNYGELTVAGGTVENCKSETGGGGIYNVGTLNATNLYVENNVAQVRGGGIWNHNGDGTFEGGYVRNNRVTQETEDDLRKQIGFGGGICNNGALILRDLRIVGNWASCGGGISSMVLDKKIVSYIGNGYGTGNTGTFDTTTLVSHCQITSNVSIDHGGGIFAGDAQYGSKERMLSVTIERNTTVSKNTAGSGGGVFIYDKGAVHLESSSITKNRAENGSDQGGGICIEGKLAGALQVTGKPIVRDNTSSLYGDSNSNVYIGSNTIQPIQLVGKLEEGAQILVHRTDSKTVWQRVLTTGYSDYMNDADPALYISMDNENETVYYKYGEARVGVNVPYIDYVDGTRTPSSIYDYTVLETNGDNRLKAASEDEHQLPGGWYVCNSSLRVAERIYLKSGEPVHIILCNTCYLDCEKGINVESNENGTKQVLNIYGQENDGTNEGMLLADCHDDYFYSGIGSICSHWYGCGDINIFGGKITARGGALSPGIGHGSNDGTSKHHPQNGVYTQWGGTVVAEGYRTSSDADGGWSGAAGIGGGYRFPNMKTVINGGTVSALGSHYGPGIGCGSRSGYEEGYDYGDLQYDVIINGGYVEATGGTHWPGIGIPRHSGSGKLVFRGGTTKVTSISEWPGIMAEYWTPGIFFCGGTVEVISRQKVAQIQWDVIEFSKDPDNKDYAEGSRVLSGSSSSDAQSVLASERLDTVRNKKQDHTYVRIEPCTEHEYEYDTEGMTATCKWCGDTVALHTVTLKPGDGTGETITKTFKAGDVYTLPTREEAGYSHPTELIVLSGWKVDGEDTVYHPGEEMTVTQDATLVAQWSFTWADLQNYINELGNHGNEVLNLSCDLTATESDSALVVPRGKDITINLNGYTLDRNLDELVEPTDTEASPGSVFVVEGNLTLIDRGDKGHITGGYATTGGGVYVADGGSVTLNHGLIDDNVAQKGGGVYVADGGEFRFFDGYVSGNTATEGGGLYVAEGGTVELRSYGDASAIVDNTANNGESGQGGGVLVEGTLEMSKGSIERNHAKDAGGGLVVRGGGKVALSGGSITDNQADGSGGGVYVYADGIFDLGGRPTIQENVAGTTGGQADSNVFLPTGAVITVTSGLALPENVGVSVEEPPAAGESVVLTDGLYERGKYQQFTSENEGYLVGCNAQGEAILGAPVIVSFDAGEGEGEMDAITLAAGSSYQLPACDFDEPDGLDFLGWQIDGETAVRDAGSTIEVTQNITLTAQYGREYDIWVNDVRVTAANCDDVLSDGTVAFVPRTNTLHLDNPTFTTGHMGAAIYAENVDLTVAGTATMTSQQSYGISVSDGSVTLSGDLAIAGSVRGVYANRIVVADGTISVTAGMYGLGIRQNSTGGIVVEDDVERLEVQATHPLYAMDDSITIGDRLFIELPEEGSVYRSEYGVRNSSVVDAEGIEADHVVIVPHYVHGTKTWVAEGVTLPQSVTVRLFADGVEKDHTTVTADDGWTWHFDVPRCDEGRVIAYTITEDAVPDFTAEVDGYDVTNTYDPNMTQVNVNMAWDDGGDRDALRPAATTVHLLADGVDTGQTLELSDDNNWSGTFDKLEASQDGKTIAYTVTADTVAAYTTAITGTATEGFAITNTHTPASISLPVSIVWNDANDQDGWRPDAVLVRLLADGKEVASAAVDADDNWTYTFAGMPKNAAGKPIDYTLTENAISSYAREVKGSMDEGFTVTNTHTPETVEINFSKEWRDQNDQDGIRPESVTVTLTGTAKIGGATETVYTDTVTTKNDRWQWVRSKYYQGVEIDYRIAETDKDGKSTVPQGYEATVEGFTIINDHTPEAVSVSGTLTWDDDNNRDGIRPQSVELCLKADGEEKSSSVFTPDENGTWSWEFENAPRYQAGKEIVYTVSAVEVEGYTSTTDDDVITLTHEPATKTLTVKKEWDDDGNRDARRPESIVVSLKAGDAYCGTVTLSAKTWWAGSISGLYQYENGKEIAYTWEERSVPDRYELIKTETDGDVTTLTNKHEPAKTDTGVTITWVDGNDEEGLRPDEVKVWLMCSGVRQAKYTLNESNGWSASETGLYVFGPNGRNDYTWAVDSDEWDDNYKVSYTTSDGFMAYTYTLAGTTDFTVTKVWDDADNQDGMRPNSLAVSLYGNNVRLFKDGDMYPDEDGNWTYTWHNLTKYDGNSGKITYSVSENSVAHYNLTSTESVEGGVKLTNTHAPDVRSVHANVVWLDGGNAASTRPESVSVTLSGAGKSYPLSLDGDHGWASYWTDLPVNHEGSPIVYPVPEAQTVNGYALPVVTGTADTGFTVTYTLLGDLSVKKSWDDADNQDGKRPESLDVTLMAHNDKVKTVTLTAEQGWSATAMQVPLYDENNAKIPYTWEESALPEGYQLTGNETTGTATTLTNAHKPETTDISVKVIWDDDEDRDGLRPTEVTTTLVDAEGNQRGKASLREANGWAVTIHNLPVYANGQKIDYSWTQSFDGLGDTYTETSATADMLTTFTNTHEPATTAASVTKVWDDEDNVAQVRPEELSVTLLANGEETDTTVVLNEGNEWKATVEGLFVNEAGSAIDYSWVEEDPSAGYELTATTVDEVGYTTTLTNTLELVQPTVQIAWDDHDNQDGNRPQSVVAHLMVGDEVVRSVTLSAANDWKAAFDPVPVNDAEGAIEYTVTVDDIANYTPEVTGDVTEGFTVTSTYTPAPKTYAITYNLNGGSYNGSTADIVEKHQEGSVIEVHAAPTRAGYTFDYWKGSAYQPGDQYTVEGDHTFVAQWKKNTPGNSSKSGSSQKSGPVRRFLARTGDSGVHVAFLAGMALAGAALVAGSRWLKRRK